MNIRLRAVVLLLAVGFASASARGAAAPAADTRPRIALMGVQAGEGFTPKQIVTVEELLLWALQTDRRFLIVGRSDFNAILGLEAQKQVLGCGDNAACVAEIAGALGVEYVAAADIGRLGTIIIVTLKVVEVKTATAKARARRTAKADEELVATVDQVAAEALNTIAETGAAPSPQVPVAAIATASPSVPAAAAAPGPASSPATASGQGKRIATYSTLGVGVIALAVGIGLGLAARSDASDLRTKPHLAADATTLAASVNSRVRIANYSSVGGGVLCVAGVGLMVVF